MSNLGINLQKGSLKFRIASEIKNKIFEGKLLPGDKITEIQLAEEIGVSRGPVREAIQLLEMEGLFTSVPYKGTTVSEISEDEVINLLIPIRLNVENYVLNKIMPLDQDQLNTLENIIGEMEVAVHNNDVPAIVESDIKFHETFIMFTNMESIKDIWVGIVNRIRLYFLYNGRSYENLSDFVSEHKQLLDALSSGDIEVARKVLRPHILDAVDFM